MLTRMLVSLILLVPLIALGLAYLAWQVELWPLAVVLSAYAAIWVAGAVGAASGDRTPAVSWGGFLLRYLVIVAVSTLGTLAIQGRRLEWLGWVAVFLVALVLRERVNDVAAALALGAFVLALSWRPVEGLLTWRREGGAVEVGEVPEAVGAMLGLATHPMLTAALVIGHATVGFSLLPYVDAFSEAPNGVGEIGAFLLAVLTGAFAHSVVTSVFAGDAAQRIIESLNNEAPR